MNPEIQAVLDGQSEGCCVCADCLDVLKLMPAGCVDLVCTDPPYGIGIAAWDKCMPFDWFPAAYRLGRQTGAIYCFGDSLTLSAFQVRWANEFGIRWRSRCVWVYEDGPRSTKAWTSKHEDCLVYCGPRHMQDTPKEPSIHKDPRWDDDRLVGDVWRVPRVLGNYKERVDHPTQKPLALMRMIIQAASKPGDLILDPFCGSGTTLVAAKMLGRRYIGIDISPDYVAISKARLEAVDTGVPVNEAKVGQMALFADKT